MRMTTDRVRPGHGPNVGDSPRCHAVPMAEPRRDDGR